MKKEDIQMRALVDDVRPIDMRAYLAGMALQGLLSGDAGSDLRVQGNVRLAVEYADALLSVLAASYPKVK